MKVLLVDDDAAIRRVVRRAIMSDFGVEVCEAEDGLGALEKLSAEAFDLVILDIAMKVMDGVETLEAIRRTEGLSELPVVMITGAADEKRARQLIRLKVNGVLIKPFSPNVLHDRLMPILAQVTAKSSQELQDPRLNLGPSSRVFIVGPDDDYRTFLQTRLGHHCEVTAFTSAAAALRAVLARPPDAVFVTGVDPLMPPALFSKKLPKDDPARPRLFLVDSPGSRIRDAESLFDGRLDRVAQPQALMRGLRSLLTDTSMAGVMLHPNSPCVESMFKSAAATVASAMKGAIGVQAAAPLWNSSDERTIEASTSLQVNHRAWTLRLLLTYGQALNHAKHYNNDNTDLLSEADLIETTSTFAQELATHLLAPLSEYGIPARLGKPTGRAARRFGSLAESLQQPARWFSNQQKVFAAAVHLAADRPPDRTH